MSYIKREPLLQVAKELQGNMLGAPRIVNVIEMAPAEDVVEVVRCKDCQYSRPINKTKSPEKYFKDDCIVCECEDVVGDEPMVYLPYHFCSYGKRYVN